MLFYNNDTNACEPNACTSNPCPYDADCSSTSAEDFECSCTGPNRYFNDATNQCPSQSYCHSEGPEFTFSCDEPKYHNTVANTCEPSACASYPCPRDSACFSEDLFTFTCVCVLPNFIFNDATNTCEPASPSPCDSHPCPVDSTCSPIGDDDYSCTCTDASASYNNETNTCEPPLPPCDPGVVPAADLFSGSDLHASASVGLFSVSTLTASFGSWTNSVEGKNCDQQERWV